jgi:hypothetical protein
MATYVNDLRLTELATGEGSGTWGTTTNTSLELIGEALGYATQQAFGSDADATTTVADGASDPARAMYYKITSAASLTATRTLTIAPNTISRVMFIENATSGSQSIAISQGSGASVTILTGKTAVVYLDGAGAGAAVVDAMAGVDPGVTDTLTEVLVAGNTSGGTNIELSTTDKVQFRDAAIYLNSSVDGQLDIVADTEIQIAATTVDLNGNLDVSGTTVSAGKITADAGIDIDNINIDGTTIALSSGDLTLDVAGDIVLDAGGSEIRLSKAGTEFGKFATDIGTPSQFAISSSVLDGDIKLQGNDGGITITALTLDMSEAGAATFNSSVTATGTSVFASLDISGDIDVDGTSNLDILDVDGAANFAADVTLADGADLITASAGTSNLRLGVNAGNSIESGGTGNVAVGDEAGTAITTGDYNTALGYFALYTEDTASKSTAVGTSALQVQNAGTVDALNTAVGFAAGGAVTTGVSNTLIGGLAGDALTSGNSNVALGFNALTADTLGDRAVAIGLNALASQNFTSSTDNYNVGVGYQAGYAVTTGTANTLIGGLAGDAITTASQNTAVGYNALTATTTGAANTAVGFEALDANTTAANNTGIGWRALYLNTTGTRNNAVGATSLDANTTGSYNNAFGYNSLGANTTGAENVGMGDNALAANTTGSYNAALGTSSLANNSTASNNTAVGYAALNVNTTGTGHTVVGAQAGKAVTTGSGNTFLGKYAGYATTTGHSNVFIGYRTNGEYGAGHLVTTGSKNTIIGSYNGNEGSLDIRTSSNNIVLSDGDGNPRLQIDANGDVGIGSAASISTRFEVSSPYYGARISGTEPGINYPVLTLKNAHAHTGNTATQIDFKRDNGTTVGTITSTTGSTSYNTSSDYRLKENVSYEWDATTRLKQLKPARFNFISLPDTTVDGFLAHEAQEIVPECVTGTKDAVDADGVAVMQGIDQSKLVPLLVKAVQEQQALIESLTARITTLEG